MAAGLAAPSTLATADDASGHGSQPDCVQEREAWRCTWTLVTGGYHRVSYPLPAYDRSLLSVTVVLEGDDGGWYYTLRDETGAAVSASRHYPDPLERSGHYAQTDTHLVLQDAEHPIEMAFASGATRYTEGRDTPRSTGTFRFIYVAERLPEGEVPSRPAATREAPHLRDDQVLDTSEPWLDLTAAWFDDARLGDGLLDVHLALESLDGVEGGARRDGQSRVLSWYVEFRVLDRDYLVRWFAASAADGALEEGCELRSGAFGSGPTRDLDDSTLVMTPHCRIDRANATLHAEFPERSIGSPPDGLAFEQIHARSLSWTTTQTLLPGSGTQQTSMPEQADNLSALQFPFALGGPAVWSRLYPPLDPPPVPPWYAAPFHEENLPDTLQVAGAAMAALTFLGGLVLLGGRRRRLRQLLDRVDRVVEKHEADARAALLALGELDVAFSRMFRQGRLNEAQYQVVTQRVASAATRFALRRELGLDDGTPGDAQERGAAARRIPVKAEPARAEAEP